MKRTDLDKWAAVAGHKKQEPGQPVPQSRADGVVVMRDQPSVRELEDVLLLYGAQHRELFIERVARGVFGIGENDTLFEFPEELEHLPEHDPRVIREVEKWEKYEDQFEAHEDLTDDETMELLKKLGVDFSDERGQPLRCTKLLARVAEAAARGIKGKLPDKAETAARRWADALSAEAAAFLAKKRKR